MMADDAEIDEEIERQLEAEANDQNYLQQPLLDDNELAVNNNILFFSDNFYYYFSF
jgi:hypothetical protein